MVVYTAAANIEDILLSFTLLHTKYLPEALTERECIQLYTLVWNHTNHMTKQRLIVASQVR